MALLMMLLAVLNVGNFNAPMTDEEIQTKATHLYCEQQQNILDDRGMVDHTYKRGRSVDLSSALEKSA